ncbi:hypothetical protein CG51_11345 [Haematobacter missouriensis]|nr:hypothetical protein [Haematobacter missouriensis]KFI26947.1 hypothetical protein CG51_11345 [Haematobacter missouriensis]
MAKDGLRQHLSDDTDRRAVDEEAASGCGMIHTDPLPPQHPVEVRIVLPEVVKLCHQPRARPQAEGRAAHPGQIGSTLRMHGQGLPVASVIISP